MQHRDKLILEFWDRSNELSTKNNNYKNFLRKFSHFLLNQDVVEGDITTNSLIRKNKKIFAMVIAKQNGILAGMEEFKFLNKDLEIKSLKNDGDEIRNGDILVKIKGNIKKILSQERIFLNLLQRMSGIATLTNTLNNKLKNKIKIAATRKTLWGYIDKKAVSIGGGLTHRLNLSDSILVKDNHLKILNYDFEKVLAQVKNRLGYVEVEVENKNDALTIARIIKKKFTTGKFFFAIMLDKIPPNVIKSIIEELKNQDLYKNILFEASGNITPTNLKDYINCGVDIISMGYLTNSAKSLDISLDIL